MGSSFNHLIFLLNLLIIAEVMVETCSILPIILSHGWICGQLRDAGRMSAPSPPSSIFIL